YMIELVLGYDILKLGSLEYLRTRYIDPRIEYNHTTTLKSMLHFKYQRKYFSQDAQSDLDSKHYEIGYALQKILSPRSYIQANLSGLREKKKQGRRIDVDYDEYRVSVAYANQFTTIYATEVFAEYRRRTYEDYSTLFRSTRVDNAGMLSGVLNAKILESLRFHLKTSYNRVWSNQAKFAFHKYTITAGINKTF
ncbi:MAG: DUF560 domain-containing protein, partial [Epsilonproteobacteria bacterium]|nr:DUF560 domain-containing protein [Campylobacterota bacterium]